MGLFFKTTKKTKKTATTKTTATSSAALRQRPVYSQYCPTLKIVSIHTGNVSYRDKMFSLRSISSRIQAGEEFTIWGISNGDDIKTDPLTQIFEAPDQRFHATTVAGKEYVLSI